VLKWDCVSSSFCKATDNCWNRYMVAVESPVMSVIRLTIFIIIKSDSSNSTYGWKCCVGFSTQSICFALKPYASHTGMTLWFVYVCAMFLYRLLLLFVGVESAVFTAHWHRWLQCRHAVVRQKLWASRRSRATWLWGRSVFRVERSAGISRHCHWQKIGGISKTVLHTSDGEIQITIGI